MADLEFLVDPKVLGFAVPIAEVVGAVLEGLVHVDHHPLVVLCPWSQTFLVQNHKHPLWQGDKLEQTIPSLLSNNAHRFYLLPFSTPLHFYFSQFSQEMR